MVPRPSEIVRRRLTVATILRTAILFVSAGIVVPLVATQFFWFAWIAVSGSYTWTNWNGTHTWTLSDAGGTLTASLMVSVGLSLVAMLCWALVPATTRSLVPFRRADLCPQCRYPVMGLNEPRCPECGTWLDDEFRTPTRRPRRWPTSARSIEAGRATVAAVFRFFGVCVFPCAAIAAVVWLFALLSSAIYAQSAEEWIMLVAVTAATGGLWFVWFMLQRRAMWLAEIVVPQPTEYTEPAPHAPPHHGSPAAPSQPASPLPNLPHTPLTSPTPPKPFAPESQ